jgi:hypothetical protein
MIIVKPVPVLAANLVASNVAEDDHDVWEAGEYVAGNRVIYQNRIYEALTTTSEQPDEGAEAQPPSWVFVSATNRFKMFDITVGQGTSNDETIDVSVNPPVVCNAAVLFNVKGNRVKLVVRDSGDYLVYDRTIDIIDFSNIASYYDYFFADFSSDGQSEIAFLDVPGYFDATFEVLIDGGSGIASCGEMIIGRMEALAVTNFGTSVGIKDYSVKEVDQFGNLKVVQRPFSKRAEYDVTVETNSVGRVSRFFSSIRAMPVVYVGDMERSETIILGYYREFNIIISSPSISECTLTVEGLI